MADIAARTLHFAKVTLALYLAGNASFRIAAELAGYLETTSVRMHAAAIAICVRTLLQVLSVAFLFWRDLRLEVLPLAEHLHCSKTAIIAAIAIVFVQIATSTLGGASLNPQILSVSKIVCILIFAVCAAISEELICRLIILGQGRKAYGAAFAFVLQALFFLYMHFIQAAGDRPKTVFILLTGIAIRLVYMNSGSLVAAIAMHLFYDIGAIVVYGASLDGAHITPWIVEDNVQRALSLNAASLLLLVVSAVLLLQMRLPTAIRQVDRKATRLGS